jgi:hypothetical protein
MDRQGERMDPAKQVVGYTFLKIYYISLKIKCPILDKKKILSTVGMMYLEDSSFHLL